MQIINTIDFIGLFMLLAGFIVGLGAVTVIDLHGFMGRKSEYWTEATTRTHKITKPLIWLGIALAIVGGLLFYRNDGMSRIPFYHLVIAIVLILNGCFLSFVISPFLLEREKQGKQKELLPKSWQNKITVSFIFSFAGWWGSLILLVYYLLMKIK